MSIESAELKRRLLELLDKDEEFRYAVAGRLGLSEILKRLDKLEENQVKLWENQNKLWEEVKSIRGEIKNIRAEVKSLGRAVGRTLEDYTIAFVEIILEERGYPKEKIRLGRRKIAHEKEEEINIFNEDPLVVGEVTTYIESEEKAIDEIGKVVRRIKLAQRMFGRKVVYAFLAVGNVPKDVLEKLKEKARRNEIELIFGKTIETQELV